MIRPNSILPLGKNDQEPDYDYADGVTLVYPYLMMELKLP